MLNVDGSYSFILEHPIVPDYVNMTKKTYFNAHLDACPDELGIIYANIENTDMIMNGEMVIGWITRYMHFYPPPKIVDIDGF